MDKGDSRRQPLKQLDENVDINRRSGTNLYFLRKNAKRELEKKRSASECKVGHMTIRAESKRLSSYETVDSKLLKHDYSSPLDQDDILCNSGVPLPEGVLDIDAEERDELCPYSRQIFTYLRKQEEKFLAESDFISQNHITNLMRAMLVEWLIEVQTYEGLMSESLHLSVAIVDRYLSLRNVEVKRVQLLGIGAILIASKFVERFPPTAQRLCYFTDDSYQPFELLIMEQHILRCLDFQINQPLPLHFLHRCLNASPDLERSQLRTIRLFASYLFELHQVDANVSTLRPSLRAAAAVYLGRTLFCPVKPRSTPTFLHYTCYTEKELRQCACIYLKLLKGLVTKEHAYTAARKKFSGRRYGEIAKHSQVRNAVLLNYLLKELTE